MEKHASEDVQTKDEVTDHREDATRGDFFFLFDKDLSEIGAHVWRRGRDHKEICRAHQDRYRHRDADHQKGIEHDGDHHGAHREVNHVPRDQREFNVPHRLAVVGFAFEDGDHRKGDIGDTNGSEQSHENEGHGYEPFDKSYRQRAA